MTGGVPSEANNVSGSRAVVGPSEETLIQVERVNEVLFQLNSMTV